MGEKVRDIKFRAWNGKEMFNVDVLAISPCTWDCPDYGKRGVSLAYQPHIKIMQYTGLNDKNGKEIYEGDILKVPDLYETPENTYPTYHYETVIYANYGFGTDSAMFYEDGDYISEECEVVGNIYENPELLEAPDLKCNPPCDSSLRDGINEQYCCKEVKE